MMRLKRRSKGFSSLLAVFFVTLFGVLAIAFAGLSTMNMRMAVSHRDITSSQAAAESGLAYTHSLVQHYLATASQKTFERDVTQEDAYTQFDNFYNYLYATVADTVFAAGGGLGTVKDISEGTRTGQAVTLSGLALAGDDPVTCDVQVRQWHDAPAALEVVSTGSRGEVSRRVFISYSMVKDTNLLKYAVASKSPIRITDDSTIGDGIYTDWAHPEVAPPITLAGISTINGDVNTVLGLDDFLDLGYTLEDLVTGTHDGINYDQPELDLPTADDFDTSSYASEVKVLSSGHTYNQKEYYPHAPGSYTTPIYGSVELNRTVYENLTIVDRRAIAGNALFKNCTFEGYFYVGTTDGIGTNNVRFENCTFNGPVITGVPPKFGLEEWKKNCLYFTGTNTFNNTALDEATILAPNYNVDLGGTTSSTAITGLIVGGVVDVRGDAVVDGTILSMADPMELGALAGLLDTNVGISDTGGHTIQITPRPGSYLPMGMASRILFVRQPNSYVEL